MKYIIEPFKLDSRFIILDWRAFFLDRQTAQPQNTHLRVCSTLPSM